MSCYVCQVRVAVHLSANHLGSFVFRLCPRYPASQVQYSTVQHSTVQYSDNDQACLNTHVLQFADTGLTAHTVGEGTGTFSMMVSIYLSTEATRSMKKHSAFYNEFS